MSRLSDGWLDEYEHVIIETSEGGQYELGDAYGKYKPMITLHLTDTYDFTRDQIRRHTSPSHTWANYQRNELTQTVNLKRAARALYQQQFGEAWTNRHFLNMQVEWVKKASYVPTASDDELRWLAAKAVVPFILFIRSQGYDIQIRSDPTVPMGGAASESWKYRYTEQQLALCNWIADHARVTHQSHWDVCAENKVLIAAYAAADPRLSGISPSPTPPAEEEDMFRFVYNDPKRGGDGTLYITNGTDTWPMKSMDTKDKYVAMGLAKPDIFLCDWGWINTLKPHTTVFEDRVISS